MHRWVLARGEHWCIEDEHGTVVSELFEVVEAAVEAARAMVEALGRGIVYVPRPEGVQFDALRVP